MNAPRTTDYVEGLVREFCSLRGETEWVEFKRNNSNPEEIGEYISALANTATLRGKAHGYLIWGVDDESRELVGTTFVPMSTKKGNEELENWLLRQLTPRIGLRFYSLEIEDKPVVVLEIDQARLHPVRFRNQEFIRVGSYKKKLKDFTEKERELWRIFEATPFESGVAAERVGDDEVLRLLDYPAYFDLMGLPLPSNKTGILSALKNDILIRECEAGGWEITNLGAVLFAKHLSEFSGLSRKAMRVVLYRGASRVETVKEQVGDKGYASGFGGLIGYINDLVPSNEVIEQGIRRAVPMYPEIAVREIVANALIHQDLSITGAGPTVEIFRDRLEVTDPGKPLMSAERFLDTPPRSRNELLASLMRRLGICEERGSGVDKVVFQAELYQLPAPLFEVTGNSTRAVLFGQRHLTKMDKRDRIRACYLHSCLKYVERDYLTNTSLRERFGIKAKSAARASRLIKEAVEARQIQPHDPMASKKEMKYVPWWAAMEAELL